MKYDKIYNQIMQEMSNQDVEQILSGLNSLASGGVESKNTTGSATSIAQGQTTTDNETNISPEMQAKLQEILSKIPPEKLAEYQKNPEKFGAINTSSIDMSKYLKGPS
jgi:hypothetical protein